MIEPMFGASPQPPARSIRRLRHERMSVGDSAAPSSSSFAEGLFNGFKQKMVPSASGGSTENNAASSSSTNSSSSVASGLHQRLLEIERRLREFNILDSKNANNNGAPASSSNINSNQLHTTLTGCRTSPLPRRPMPLFMSNDSSSTKRREFDWTIQNQQSQPQQQQNGNRTGTPKTRHRLSDGFETQQRINAIMQQTGVLKFGGKEYKMQTYDLELIKDLGHGTHGHVVKMKHKETGLFMAVKQIRRSGNKEETKQSIMDLEVVLRSHDCPYIVQCLGCFVSDSEVWICMELMDTCMDKLIRRTGKGIPEPIIGKVALSIVKALSYLKEKQGVIHRDVKPSNILMNRDGTIKLCDFGISGRLVDSKAATQTAGCAAYMAPERIQPPDPENANYDIRADVWSLGISLVELTLGRFPYGVCENHFEILTKILLTDSPSLSPSDGFSQMYCDFLDKCLAKDYNKRYKYPELLSHEFLQYYETHDVDVAGWFRNVVSPFYADSP